MPSTVTQSGVMRCSSFSSSGFKYFIWFSPFLSKIYSLLGRALLVRAGRQALPPATPFLTQNVDAEPDGKSLHTQGGEVPDGRGRVVPGFIHPFFSDRPRLAATSVQ